MAHVCGAQERGAQETLGSALSIESKKGKDLKTFQNYKIRALEIAFLSRMKNLLALQIW